MPILTMSRPPIWSLACLGLMLGFASTVHAQGVPRSKQRFNRGTAFVGATGRTGPNCPPLEFHVVPTGNDRLEGVAFEPTASPPQIFSISGSIADNGKVAMELKSVGSGSPLKVEGMFDAGTLTASINGGGTCKFNPVILTPVTEPTSEGSSN
jgi:hypothetical protein